ncbi:MAG: biotin/lipoyl-binding protein [Nitrospirota bacterium]|nr:biotin/lipoyl-binding protein [Nitrospirota bacterium]MDH5774678.1 biotin/lipoyl-binding protein [Nitrospirota bacterium]
MSLAPASPQEDLVLPPLRDDLQILSGTPTAEGVPTWNILDPVRHQYFQIGWAAFQLLSQWHLGSATRLIEVVSSSTTAKVTQRDVMELVQFLFRHNLTRDAQMGGSKGLFAQAEQAKQHWLLKLLHTYLFFKIPLFNPDRFLQRTLPIVAPFFTKTALIGVVVLGVIGCMGIVRQWESFANTFLYFFSPQGLTAYMLGLAGIKVLHELGHAYTAARYGCKVQTMGVGFLIMVPVLYTDTTDSWKLTSQKQRAAIAAAGTVVELGIAMIATFLWHLCPEGVVKSVLFVLASTSWIMGLFINLNPLLRFDGYYVLSDWLGVPNLQSRAFAFGQWKLRECLFGWGDAPPEALPRPRQRILTGYAWAIWVYRAFMFLGIAVLVYHFFFKVLGILLFVVEIGWFLAWPVYQEVQVWWKRREEVISSWRGRGVGAVVVVMLLAGLIPLDRMVAIPAVLEARDRATIFSPVPARILEVKVQEGDHVEKGEPLVLLESPNLEQQIQMLAERLAALEMRVQREAAYQEDRDDHQVTGETLQGARNEMEGLLKIRDQLTLRAPFRGTVTDMASSLHQGRWVNSKLPLVHLMNPQEMVVQAYATEEQQVRLASDTEGWFYADDPAREPRRGRVQDLRQVDESQFALTYLASVYAGPVPVRKDEQGHLKPETSIYRVTLDVDDAGEAWTQAVRGLVHVEGESRSVVRQLWEHVGAVFIRESGM